MPQDKFVLAQRRSELRKYAVAYKGGKCVLCGYNRCLPALDFHHTEAKDFNISDHMSSWKAIRAELEKTVLVCANCHREIHDGLHPEYYPKGEIGDGIFWEDDEFGVE